MREDNLVIGKVYFMVTFPDISLTKPIVITYEYIGKKTLDEPMDDAEYVHLFRYLPAFRYEKHEECFNADEVPTVFTNTQLEKLSDISGLLAELTEVRRRLM